MKKNATLKLCAVMVAAGASLMGSSARGAISYVYNFESMTGVNPVNDGETAHPGTTTIGEFGQDNWVWTSGTADHGAIVRNDAKPGLSGNWGSGSLSTTNGQYDSINTRKSDANFSYAIGATTRIQMSAKLFIGSSSVASDINRRAEVGFAYDTNNDGKIRPTAAAADNSEWGPIFGFEGSTSTSATGHTWYVRGAALGTANTVTADVTGVWLAVLDVDLTANSGDGSGRLLVQQLYDGAGNPVNGTLTEVAGLTSVNLQIKRMQTVTGGTAAAASAANWNGLFTRYSGGGGIDDITVTVPEPTSLVVCGAVTLMAVRRRRVG